MPLIPRLFVCDARGLWKASPLPADGDRVLVGIQWEGLAQPHRVGDLRVPGGASLLRLGSLSLLPASGWLILPQRYRVTLGRGPGGTRGDHVQIDADTLPRHGAASARLYALFTEIGTELDATEGWGVHGRQEAAVQGPGIPMGIQADRMPEEIPWAIYRVLGVGWNLMRANILHLKVPALRASDGTAQESREHVIAAEGCGWEEVLPFTVQPHPFVETRPMLLAEHELLNEEGVWLVAQLVHDDVFAQIT